MKKSITSASPFLMLLVPVFFCIALLIFDAPADVSANEFAPGLSLKLPTFQAMVKAIF